MERLSALQREERKQTYEEEEFGKDDIENSRGTFMSTIVIGDSPSRLVNKREEEDDINGNIETEYEDESYETNEDTIITNTESENKLSMLINEKIAKRKKRGSQVVFKRVRLVNRV